MSTKTKSTKSAAKIDASLFASVESLTGKPVEELVTFASAQFATGQAAYINAAKAMIVIDAQGKDSAKLLVAAGVKKSTVQNARYAVRFYDGAVRTKLVAESEFDQLGYLDFYRAVIVADRLGKSGWKSLADRHLLTEAEELQSLYDHGKTRAEVLADEKKAKDAAAAKAKADEEAKAKQVPAAPPPPAPQAPKVDPQAAKDLAAKVAGEAKTSPATPASEPSTGQAETPAATPVPATPPPPPPAPVPTANGPTIGDLVKLLASATAMAEAIMQANPETCELVTEHVTGFGQAVADAAQAITDAATAPASASA